MMRRQGNLLTRVEENGHLTYWRVTRETARDRYGTVTEYVEAVPNYRREAPL